jgi:hypothetical protein
MATDAMTPNDTPKRLSKTRTGRCAIWVRRSTEKRLFEKIIKCRKPA